MEDKVTLLSKVDIFSGLSPDSLHQLANRLNSISLKKNSLVIDKDSQGDSLYIIRLGEVKVLLQNEEGKEMILTKFKSGDFFGEMSLVDRRPRSATVITTEKSQLLTLSRSAFAKPSCVPSWSSSIPARLFARASSNCASAPGNTEASSLLSAWQSSAVRPW